LRPRKLRQPDQLVGRPDRVRAITPSVPAVRPVRVLPVRVRAITPSVVRVWVAARVFPEHRGRIPVPCHNSGEVPVVPAALAVLEAPVVVPVVPAVVPVVLADVPVRRLAVPAARVVPAAASVGVVPAALVAPVDQVDQVDPEARAVPEALEVPAAVAAVAGVDSGGPVAAATRRVRSASPEDGLRADASPSAPSARNSTTWKPPRSVACDCPGERGRPFGCHAVHR